MVFLPSPDIRELATSALQGIQELLKPATDTKRRISQDAARKLEHHIEQLNKIHQKHNWLPDDAQVILRHPTVSRHTRAGMFSFVTAGTLQIPDKTQRAERLKANDRIQAALQREIFLSTCEHLKFPERWHKSGSACTRCRYHHLPCMIPKEYRMPRCSCCKRSSKKCVGAFQEHMAYEGEHSDTVPGTEGADSGNEDELEVGHQLLAIAELPAVRPAPQPRVLYPSPAHAAPNTKTTSPPKVGNKHSSAEISSARQTKPRLGSPFVEIPAPSASCGTIKTRHRSAKKRRAAVPEGDNAAAQSQRSTSVHPQGAPTITSAARFGPPRGVPKSNPATHRFRNVQMDLASKPKEPKEPMQTPYVAVPRPSRPAKRSAAAPHEDERPSRRPRIAEEMPVAGPSRQPASLGVMNSRSKSSARSQKGKERAKTPTLQETVISELREMRAQIGWVTEMVLSSSYP